MAEPYYVDMAFHGPPDISPIAHAANVHVDLSIPNFGIQEWVPPWKELSEVIKGGPMYENGYLTVSDKPGLGVDIDEEKAAIYEYKRDYIPMVRKMNGSVTDW
jgi:mannonate dehydratase